MSCKNLTFFFVFFTYCKELYSLGKKIFLFDYWKGTEEFIFYIFPYFYFKIKVEADKIFAKYLARDAPSLVNVNQSAVENLEKKLDKPNKEIFDVPQNQVSLLTFLIVPGSKCQVANFGCGVIHRVIPKSIYFKSKMLLDFKNIKK